MNKKYIIGIVVLIVIAVIVFASFSIFKSASPTGDAIKKSDAEKAPVKEFSMQSYTEIIDGKMKPQFSLKEITVNKGDLVKIKITTTSGNHNFNIDEFKIYAETPLNKEVVVEFVADKAGEFVYYCSKPGHRQNGHWGTLKILK